MSPNDGSAQNVADVINEANQKATDHELNLPFGIAWSLEAGMWIIYDLRDGCPKDHEPEFVCFGVGVQPLPLNETAILAWSCIINQCAGLRPAA